MAAHGKKIAVGVYFTTLAGLGLYASHRRVEVPFFKRKRILLYRPSWDIFNGDKLREVYGVEWEELKETNKLNQSLASIRDKGLKRFMEDYEIDSETSDLIKSLNWRVRTGRRIAQSGWSTSSGRIAITSKNMGDYHSRAILCHEMSHVVLRHANERQTWEAKAMAAGYLAPTTMMLLFPYLGVRFEVILLIFVGFFLSTQAGLLIQYLKLHRRQETEADILGLMLWAYSGMNPEIYYKSMDLLIDGESTIRLFATYPTRLERKAAVMRFMTDAHAVCGSKVDDGTTVPEVNSEDGSNPEFG